MAALQMKQEKFNTVKRKSILLSPWHLCPNLSLFLELSKITNSERAEKNIVMNIMRH